MTSVFADAFYWIALANPGDTYHAKARAVGQELRATRFITTDEVLAEFLTFMGKRGRSPRSTAVAMVEMIRSNANITVLPQSRTSFEAGLTLYAERLDKRYSLTDCTSMATMRKNGILDVLTHDEPFQREGFKNLL